MSANCTQIPYPDAVGTVCRLALLVAFWHSAAFNGGNTPLWLDVSHQYGLTEGGVTKSHSVSSPEPIRDGFSAPLYPGGWGRDF